MSEARKRSRKSKLEVRDDDSTCEIVSENNDETTTATKNLQKLSSKPHDYEHLKTRHWFDHDYCKSGFQRMVYPLYPTDINTDTVVEVHQEVSAANHSEDSKPFSHNIDTTFRRKRAKLLPSTNMVDYTVKSRSKLIKMCKFTPENLLSVSAEVALKSSNPVDKVLDIQMRNTWGSVLQCRDVVSAHESELQMALNAWQVWYNASKAVRECPLFYQCHICNLAWWRLQPFREHLPIHDARKMKVTIKENVHECMLICSYTTVTKMKYIEIEEDCWRCGKDVSFHMNLSRVYSCDRCRRNMYTCSAWSQHDSVCTYTNLGNFNVHKERQCKVCFRFVDSLDKVEGHMLSAHSVRSDHPVPVSCKECVQCNAKYFTFSAHNCPRSPKNSSCDYCCRKFSTKPLAVAHMLSQYNRPKLCRFCSEPFEAECQEMEHLYKNHSENYQMAYKCTICYDQNFLFVDEDSVRRHKIFCHQKKTDKRRCFYELMLIPKICLETDSVDVQFQSVADFTEKLTVAVSDNNDMISVQTTSSNPPQLRILAPEVDVTVDEVDIKQEPIEYDENGEVDYEVMLNNMFKVETIQTKPKTNSEEQTIEINISKVKTKNNSHIKEQTKKKKTSKEQTKQTDFANIKKKKNSLVKEQTKTKTTSKEQAKEIDSTNVKNKITPNIEQTEVFDFANVKIKTEPIDDIDIVENPVDNIIIKSEPIDEDEYQTQHESMELDQQNPETLTVKVEPGLDIDDINPENIVIKNEVNNDSDDELSSESIPLDKLLDLKSEGLDGAQDESLNPNEMAIDVLNPKGFIKKKKVYACHKCGYTAQYKQYRIHMKSKCSVSPGIDSCHECTKCGLKFVMFRNYVLHFYNHGYDPMTCAKCGESFDQLIKLLSHVQKHIRNNFVLLHVLNKGGEENTNSNKQVKCQDCHNVVLKRDMFVHWENHLELKKKPPKPVPEKKEKKKDVSELTVDCERVTMNNKTLEPAVLKLAIEHLQSTTTYNSEKECVICFRVFARRYDAKRHIVEHLLMDAHMNKFKHRSFRCQICSENLLNQDKYKYHMREHASMPIFKCELCDKTFSDSSNFAKHKKTHNVRVLICEMCRKKFHSRAALQKHIADHSTMVETQCPFCNATFADKRAYKRHKYQVHTKHKYKCVLCDLSFTCMQHKWDHDWEVHKERKQNADCPICQKSFRKLHDVKFHMRAEHSTDVQAVWKRPQPRKKTFAECPTCRQKFRRIKDLVDHVKSEHGYDIRDLKGSHREMKTSADDAD